MNSGEELFQIFSETKQQPKKLAAALDGFFRETGVSSAQKEAYGVYLKRRIRPAVEQLIEEEAVEKIETLERLGWFGKAQLEGFIKMARERAKTASLIWFLHLKNEKYGYEEQEFQL